MSVTPGLLFKHFALHSYAIGSTSGFPGSDLVVDSHNNVVAVTIQYRLSMFGKSNSWNQWMKLINLVGAGFLAGQAVKDGGTLNAGLCMKYFSLHRST